MSENLMDWEQHEGEEIMTEVYFIGWANTFKGYIQKKKKKFHPHVVPNLYKLLSSVKNKITKLVVTLRLKVLKVSSFWKDAEAPHKYCKI